ncbi:MAG: histidinol-phosphate transaminase [Eubacteriales bacterium]|nr:histidinol-phosphate transaminase [Eubacteriales bacterium]
MLDKKNTQERPAFHGSDIEQIESFYGIPKEQIVGFGANVNPLGLSDSVKRSLSEHLDIITSYPDRDYKELRKIIADYCSVSMDYVVTGNGSTELISLLISHRNAKHALVIGPTYSEYERELALTGGHISNYYLPETRNFQLDIDDLKTALQNDVDFLILCNPNNPTSSALKQEDLQKVLVECKQRNIFVMIDETYVEFAPRVEEITAIPFVSAFDNLMIIRGVSKFYAAPGLRLGYGVTSNQQFLSTLKKYQNPWSLNSIGAYAGELMLQDTDYIQKTRNLILSERDRCLHILQSFRYAKVYPAYGNFILIRILKEGLTSFDVFEHAIRQGMMIRDCSSFEGLPGEYIRFCIMNPKDNTRLLECLAELLA